MKTGPLRNPALVVLAVMSAAGLLGWVGISKPLDGRTPAQARALARLYFPALGSPMTQGLAGEQSQEPLTLHLPYLSLDGILRPPPKLVRRGYLGPNSRAIASGPHYVYASNGPSVIVLEPGPEGLRQVGRSEIVEGLIFDLQLVEDRLYAAAGAAGLVVFDLSNPTAPAVLTQVPTDDLALGLEVSGEEALVAASRAGLQTYDLSGERPQRLASVPVQGGARFILRKGDVAYVSPQTWDPPTIVDLSDPGSPRNAGLLGEIGETWMPAMFSMGDYLYAFDCGNCLAIFDIEDPLEPRKIDHDVWLMDGAEVAIVDPEGSRAILGGAGSLWEFDLSDPEQPIATEPQWIGRGLWDMARRGDQVLVAHTSGTSEQATFWEFELGPGGVLSIDAEKCCAPTSYFTPTLALGTMVPDMAAGSATYAYVNDGVWSDRRAEPELYSIDFSDPYEPRLGERVDSPLRPGLQMFGDHGFQLETVDDDARIAVYDLSDPARPERMAAHAVPPDPAGPYRRGRSLRIFEGGHGLYSTLVTGGGAATTTLGIFDVGSAPRITWIDERTTPGIHVRSALNARHAFVVMSDMSSGLELMTLDLAAAGGVRVLGRLDFPREPSYLKSLVAPSPDVLLAALDSGVFVIDVSDPNSPRMGAQVSDRTFSQLVRLDERHYLAIGDGTVIFDVSDPFHPSVVSTLDPTVGYARELEATQVAWRDGLLYLGLSEVSLNGKAIIGVE